MRKVVIFGNSGAGKTTLARKLAREEGLAHLDLDGLAWEPTSPPTRRPVESSAEAIRQFTARHDRWVIEGCYSDLLSLAAPDCTQLIFLNPGVLACVQNCRSRPWEPNKYESQAAQDANLEMLIEWVGAYETRQDEFSLEAHRRLFDAFPGAKIELETLA